MSSILILGASRGIGLELTRQYLDDGQTVFATHRHEADRITLRDMGAQTLKLDVHQPNDLAGLAWQLDGERLETIVVNAGIYGPRDSQLRTPPDQQQFDEVMHTNVLGAMRLVPIVAPLLFESAGTLAFVSSKMGSITETGASYGALYRVSKAAVNMVAKLAHHEYAAHSLRIVSLHPGWVRTDMGGPNASIPVQDSVAGLRQVIADRDTYPGGGFYDYQGHSLEW
ncbi:MAG: SDR family oxidoreductase [Burkholderiaceae bacterium]